MLACALALVAGAGYATFHYLGDPRTLKLIGAATGVTVAGAVETLRRVAREWGRVDLLLMWLKNADDDSAAGIIRDLTAAMSDRSGSKPRRQRLFTRQGAP